jgi:voltage-gated potassium channel Kch
MDAAAIPEEKQPHMEWVRSDPAGQPRVGVRAFSVASGRKLRLPHVNGSDSMSTSDSKSPMAVIGEASAGATTRTGDKLLDDATEAFASGSPAKVEVPARLRVIRWLDRYMDPLLVFLALATVPLLIAETAHLGPHDRHVILVANWVIYAAFAVNFALRLALADRRRAVLRELRWDLLIVVGQPALAAAEIGTAGLGTALVRLVAVLVRTLSRGGVLKRTWRKVVDQPLKLLVGGVPFLWLLFSAIVLKAERSYGPRGGVHTIGEALWWGVTTMATVGYGDIAPRSPIGRVAAGMTMVAGIGAFAVLTAKMAEFLLTARDRSAYAAVDASGHTLLLGWSAKLITIIRQLVEANASRTQADVVVLSPRPKRDVEREIHTHIPELAGSTTTLTCRTGSPRDVVDLARVRPESARAIVVVEETPTATVTDLLALLNGRSRPTPEIPIVAEVADPATAKAVRSAFGGRVLVVESQSLIARVTAQSCRQPGLGLAYEDLLDFEGSEFYEAPIPPGAAALSFGELLNAFPTCCPVGVVGGRRQLELAPPMERRLDESDALVLLAEDDSAIEYAGPIEVAAAEPADPEGQHARGPEHVLIVGWNNVGVRLLAELDQSLAPRSALTVIVDRDTCTLPPEGLATTATLTLRVVRGEDYPATLATNVADGCDHVIILAERNQSIADADARALLAALQVRHALERVSGAGATQSIVTELLDEADVELARQLSAGEFIVSEHLSSLLMAQLAETPALQAVFNQLLDPAGPQLNALPVAGYVTPGIPTSFGAVVESARNRGEIALGYRLVRYAQDAQRSFGLVMNPPKASTVQYQTDDRLIVLAGHARLAQP